jgi:endonuclease/exonuclease/phosphatase family metal-dependent hydrolase
MKGIIIVVIFLESLNLSAQHDTLKILTYNVQMLPTFLKKIKQKARAEAIIKQIDSADYDIVFFQEMFDKRISKLFWKALNDKYPYKMRDENKYFLKVKNGLMIWSKKSLENKHSIVFQQATSWDKWSKKGALFASIIKNNDTILIINTHLQSDYAIQNNAIRKKQLLDIKNEIAKSYNTRNIVFAGDFNIDILSDRESLDSLCIQPFLMEMGNYYKNEKVTRTVANNWVEPQAPSTAYDLVLNVFSRKLYLNERKIKYFKKNINNIVYDLSDHYALEAIFVF